METLEWLRHALEVYDASCEIAEKNRDAVRQKIAELECPYKVGQDVWFGGERHQVMRVKWTSWISCHWVVFGKKYDGDQLSKKPVYGLYPGELTAELPKESS